MAYECPECDEHFKSSQSLGQHRANAHEPPYQDADWLEEQYIKKEKSLKEIGDEVNAAHMTVRSWLIEHGIEIRPPGNNARSRDAKYKDADWLEKQLENRPRTHVAEDCNVSDRTIRYWEMKLL